MKEMHIEVLGRSVPIQCKEEDKDRVVTLAKKLDSRFCRMQKKSPKINDFQVMVLEALIMMDEIESQSKIHSPQAQEKSGNTEESEVLKILDVAVSELESVADRLETLVKNVQKY